MTTVIAFLGYATGCAAFGCWGCCDEVHSGRLWHGLASGAAALSLTGLALVVFVGAA